MRKEYLYVAVFSWIVSFLSCKLLVPVLRRYKAGQNILSYVKEHRSKSGTPTMGGIAFVFASVLSTLVFVRGIHRPTIVLLTVSISYMIVGFLDDLTKKKRRENLGLTPRQKIIFQTAVAIFAGIYCYQSGRTSLVFPFTNRSVDLGFWMIPLSIFIFLSAVNCVNLTDGLDGLAGATSFSYFLFLGFILIAQKAETPFVLACFSLCGALLAYLLFNSFPASVFMGDTGSLSLGSFVACLSVFSGNGLLVAVLGIMFVVSGGSVLLQVAYFKRTGGKRIFLMAPFHHHLQKKGFSETKISYAYALITALVGTVLLLLIV